MPNCIVWRRSDFGRSLMIQGRCQNMLNPQWTWHDESSASAALVLASVSVEYRLWSRQGCFWQEAHNLQVRSLDTRTKNRHAAWDDVGCYTLGNLQAMLLSPLCNWWSCHLHRERCNTHSWCWDFVQRWEDGVPAGGPRSAPLGLFTVGDQAGSEEHSGYWSESAGERPFQCCELRASVGSSKIDCQSSYIQATHSCRQQNLRDVFCRTWRIREGVYSPLWALTECRLAHHHPRISLITCASHHQSTVWMLVYRRFGGVWLFKQRCGA